MPNTPSHSRAIAALDGHVYGVGRGVRLRRALHFSAARSLAAHVYRQPAARVPPASFWNSSAAGRSLAAAMARGEAGGYYFWSSMATVRELLPFLRPTLRGLVASYAPRGAAAPVAAGRRACVLHLRLGDGPWAEAESSSVAARSVAALLAAARTLPFTPDAFELLDGGVSTHLCRASSVATEAAPVPSAARGRPPAGQQLKQWRRPAELAAGGGPSRPPHDCGRAASAALAQAFRHAFPNATVRRVLGSADDDFVRMATAPALIVGGGSYAFFAALAATGEVRMPQCTLQFGEHACAPRLLAPRLQTYRHPRCKCRSAARSGPT